MRSFALVLAGFLFLAQVGCRGEGHSAPGARLEEGRKTGEERHAVEKGETPVPAAARVWIWSDEDATLAACIAKRPAGLDVETDAPPDSHPGATIQVRFGRERAPSVTFKGHAYTTFATSPPPVRSPGPGNARKASSQEDVGPVDLAGNRLFVADFHPIASGCRIVAFDLDRGKELWSVALEGLGAVVHSEYENRVLVETMDDLVVVRGKESQGTYVECLDGATGRQVYHAR